MSKGPGRAVIIVSKCPFIKMNRQKRADWISETQQALTVYHFLLAVPRKKIIVTEIELKTKIWNLLEWGENKLPEVT